MSNSEYYIYPKYKPSYFPLPKRIADGINDGYITMKTLEGDHGKCTAKSMLQEAEKWRKFLKIEESKSDHSHPWKLYIKEITNFIKQLEDEEPDQFSVVEFKTMSFEEHKLKALEFYRGVMKRNEGKWNTSAKTKKMKIEIQDMIKRLEGDDTDYDIVVLDNGIKRAFREAAIVNYRYQY